MGCMRSCRDAPFFFRGWEDTAAWLLCAFVDAEGCKLPGMDATAAVVFSGLRLSAQNYSRVVLAGLVEGDAVAQDVVVAHHYCFFVTMGQALPAFFVVMISLYMSISLLKLPLAILSGCIQLGSQMIAYTHVRN